MTEGVFLQNRRDRAWAEVSLDRIAQNYDRMRGYLRAGCEIIAVLKANAYGHGAPAVGRLLEEKGCTLFAVASFEEAEELREHGVTMPILCLSPVPERQIGEAARRKILLPVTESAYARLLSRKAGEYGMPVACFLMLDCGLTRFGIRIEGRRAEALEEVKAVAALPGLRIHSVMAHLTAGGVLEQDALNRRQLELFRGFCGELEAAGIRLPKHCCASRFAVRYPEYQFDFVRIGSDLFGVHPSYDVGPEFLPAMQLRVRIAQIKEVPAGTYVGYGPLYRTQRETRVAVLPIGYVDGLGTRLGNRMQMLLHGRRVDQIGRLCMDYCMIDVTDVPRAQIGDIVTVFGEDGGTLLSVQEHAQLYSGTASELICLLGRRIPRLYYRGGWEITT